MELTIICKMSNYFYHKMTVVFLFGHKSVIPDLYTNENAVNSLKLYFPSFLGLERSQKELFGEF